MSVYDLSSISGPLAQPKFLPTIDQKNAVIKDPNETPIFNKHKMQLRMPETSNGNIMHITVSKNWLACILSTPKHLILLRYFLKRAMPTTEIILDKYLSGFKITKLFMDFTGQHLIISLVPKSPGLCADFLYIHGDGPRVWHIEKFKDHEITAIGFNNYTSSESTTGPILLGTSRGLIFETELSQSADKSLYRKQVYDLGLGRSKYAINGLELLRMPNSNKFIVIAAAPDCIYIFQEILKSDEISLQAIFASYVNGSQVHTTIEVKTDLNYSVFRLYAVLNEKYPKNWGWLCGDGIRVGEVSIDNANSSAILGDDIIIVDFKEHKHLTYEERRQNMPQSFVLTEHHALLLYSDHITGICLLNQEVVYEEYFHEQVGKLLNIVRDPCSNNIYVYTENSLFDIKITDEQRNIWKIYLDKEMYDMAEHYAAQNAQNLNVVLSMKADAAFKEKDYTLAANIYAESDEPFESICLKFMDLEDKHPIISYVRKRLSKLHENPDHATLLVVWVTDLYLTQINFPGRNSIERSQWQREFDEFMKEEHVAKCMQENSATIQKLITEHVDSHNLIEFAFANGDSEEVIKQQIMTNKYKEALITLSKQKDWELYYKYCPIIIEYLPCETVELLMSQGRKLDIKELVPTLIMTETPQHVLEVIKYMEYAIYNLNEENQAIHNYLLRLYAEHKPEKLISYLKNEGSDMSLVHYDINYALTTSMEFKVKEACVFLQCLVCMWDAAVDLSLSFDIKLAKETASKPQDEELRHKLWLRIAEHAIKDTNDVEKALELLKECDLLRIEDLLPFFSDFEKIDDFKKPICDALKEYNNKIQELQHDMKECSKQAERVCTDMQNIRERCIRIEANEICIICESHLMFKPFFVFSCGHKFHSECLEKHVTPMLSTQQSRKLTMLKQQVETMVVESIAAGNDSQSQRLKKREKLKQEIEEMIASDCPYCGLLIDTVDQGFIVDWDQTNIDWE